MEEYFYHKEKIVKCIVYAALIEKKKEITNLINRRRLYISILKKHRRIM